MDRKKTDASMNLNCLKEFIDTNLMHFHLNFTNLDINPVDIGSNVTHLIFINLERSFQFNIADFC